MTELVGGAASAVGLNGAPAQVVDAAPVRQLDRPGALSALLVVGGVICTAAVTGLLAARLLPFLALVLVLNHWIGTRAGMATLPAAGRLVHGVTFPPAVAALAASAGWVSLDDVRAVLGLSVAGVVLTGAATWIRRSSRHRVRVALVGSPADIMDMSTRWADNRHLQVVGGLAIGDTIPLVPKPRRPGADLASRAEDEHVHDRILAMRPHVVVVVPGQPWDPEIVRRLGWLLEDTGIDLVVASRLEGIATHRLEHERVGGVDLMRVRPSRPSWVVRGAKSLGDRILGATLLVLAAPLLVLLVCAVRLTSPGPGIFTQSRVGRQGRSFRILKLRTMTTSAEAEKEALRGQDDGNGILFKKIDDPRVTRLGRVLRKYSLDELPQLVNVVRGEMSLVGPRPALPEEVAEYNDLERRRLAVRPGMTGAWQVGGRSTLDRQSATRLDVEYVDNYRLVDDAVIALKTVDAVVRPKGAW